jgi:malonyl-CoA O-methyltransferase
VANLDPDIIRFAFNRAAKNYNRYDMIQKEIADRLLSRFNYIRVEPKNILDCSARTGYATQQLSNRFPNANIVSVECAEKLLAEGVDAKQISWPICAFPDQLPLQDNFFDVIFAHLTLHWVNDYQQCLLNWQKLLKPGGLLLFSTLGVATLTELYSSFASFNSNFHVHTFKDMHPIGDTLLEQQWINPVVDMDTIILNYASPEQLIQDLRGSGVTNALVNRSRGLMGKQRWKNMLSYYKQYVKTSELNRYPATFEVIYGHAWRMSEHEFNQKLSQEFSFPLSALKR